ncbi:MAG TPA: CotH kinase family protein [Acidobacteriaceae bacterium]
MSDQRSWFALGLCLFAALITTGCGSSSLPSGGCSAGPLKSTQYGDVGFALVSANPDLTVYPGQSEQISVDVESFGDPSDAVQIAGSSEVHGLTISSTSAAIGSTATLTVTAANDVASECFTGVSGVFSASRPITLTGTTGTGTVSTQFAMNIVLENPSFTPASTDLPVLTINTTDGAPVDSTDDYVDATLSISDPSNPANNYTGTMGIKGHGNSTWPMPKKPYRLNLDDKAPLLGMTSDSNWILLANYDDKSMLRTDVSFEMSKMFGLAWTPNTAFVEVFLNDVYEGTYQLSEKVEVSKARLNIGSIDDTDNSGNDLTGGYIGEIDNYYGDTFMMTSLVGLPIGIADPDPPTTTQSAYFSTAFTAAEASLYSANFTDTTTGWQAYWDKSSVVNYFLVEELSGNQDADDWSSDYFYKPRGDALFYRGPVWDMDIALGNTNYGAIQSPSVPWVITQAKWYAQLAKDPAFIAAVKARWTAVRPQVLTLPTYIDTRAATLTPAAQNNYSRWPTLGEKVWPNAVATGTYQGEVDYMKSWLDQRIAYMDANYLQ